MPSVVVGVKADQIAVKDAQDDFVAHGENSIYFGAREGGVEEESDFDIFLVSLANLFAQHCRQKHEVIIMDPNEIVVVDISRDSGGEQLIGFPVCVPRGLVKGDFAWMIVKERPHDFICVAYQGRQHEPERYKPYLRSHCNVYQPARPKA